MDGNVIHAERVFDEMTAEDLTQSILKALSIASNYSQPTHSIEHPDSPPPSLSDDGDDEEGSGRSDGAASDGEGSSVSRDTHDSEDSKNTDMSEGSGDMDAKADHAVGGCVVKLSFRRGCVKQFAFGSAMISTPWGQKFMKNYG